MFERNEPRKRGPPLVSIPAPSCLRKLTPFAVAHEKNCAWCSLFWPFFSFHYLRWEMDGYRTKNTRLSHVHLGRRSEDAFFRSVPGVNATPSCQSPETMSIKNELQIFLCFLKNVKDKNMQKGMVTDSLRNAGRDSSSRCWLMV